MTWPGLHSGLSEKKPAAQAAGTDPSHAASPIGKVHPFSKIAVTLEPVMQF